MLNCSLEWPWIELNNAYISRILSLFGERVTMQFMSQSTGWADNIISAMAPLGMITVIVAAIRVGAPTWLKAIIGRARESRAVAESELMSSTSKEVCELWNGQEIVRVMGEGPIREFVILLPEDDTEDEHPAKVMKLEDSESEGRNYLRKHGERKKPPHHLDDRISPLGYRIRAYHSRMHHRET